MQKFIKYKRFEKSFNYDEEKYLIQKFFDELIIGGWEIIYYNEIIEETTIDSNHLPRIFITVVVGKKQENII